MFTTSRHKVTVRWITLIIFLQCSVLQENLIAVCYLMVLQDNCLKHVCVELWTGFCIFLVEKHNKWHPCFSTCSVGQYMLRENRSFPSFEDTDWSTLMVSQGFKGTFQFGFCLQAFYIWWDVHSWNAVSVAGCELHHSWLLGQRCQSLSDIKTSVRLL